MYLDGAFAHVKCSGALVGAKVKSLGEMRFTETKDDTRPPKLASDAAEKDHFLSQVALSLAISSGRSLVYV